MLLDQYINETRDWKQIDIHAFESLMKFGGEKLILVTYAELLSYGYVYRAGVSGDKKTYEEVVTPWLACRIELEGDQSTKGHNEVIKELKEWTKKLPWKPFYDEDATFGIYRMKTSPYSRDWTQYVFYVNPDYPDGWWENHTL